MNYRLPEQKLLSEVLHGQQLGASAPDLSISGVCLDTRLASEGHLYLALAGHVSHGLAHAIAAIDAGVVAIATAPGHIDQFPALAGQLAERNVALIEVADLKAQAGHIAARFYDAPSEGLSVVAVTGTDGKTSVCRFVQSTLTALGQPCGYVGTLGWGLAGQLDATALTTPDSVTLQHMLARMRAAGARHVVLEASSHGIAEGRLDAISIDVAVLTNIGRDHLDYHGTVDAYRAAKARLFDWPTLQAVVVNAADSLGREVLDDPRHRGLSQRIGFVADAGYASASASVVADDADGHDGHDGSVSAQAVTDEGVHLIRGRSIRSIGAGLQFELIDGALREPVESPLIGRFNVDNLLACHGVLRALGHAANDARRVLADVQAVEGRMERFVSSSSAPTVLVDYAHTPQALASALSAARAHCAGELWVVFGCGGDRDPGKRAPMGRAAEAADRIVLTDDNPRTEAPEAIRAAALAGMQEPERAVDMPGRESAIAWAVSQAGPDDVVLVAGKGHEDYQVIGTTRHDYSDRRVVAGLLEQAV